MFQTIKNIAFFFSFYPVIFQQLINCLAIDSEQTISINSMQSEIPSISKSQTFNQAQDEYHKTKAIRQINSDSRDSRRPIWNLAHMVNSIKELDYRLR